MYDGFHLTLVEVEGGFQLRARSGTFNRPNAAWVLESEKARQVRVFRSAQAAFAVCKRLGFPSVTVELSSASSDGSLLAQDEDSYPQGVDSRIRR